MVSIDGIRATLAKWGGFQNFFKSKETDIDLSGYIWQIPIIHTTVVATGPKAQIDMLIDFVKELKEHRFIQTFVVEIPTTESTTQSNDGDVFRKRA